MYSCEKETVTRATTGEYRYSAHGVQVIDPSLLVINLFNRLHQLKLTIQPSFSCRRAWIISRDNKVLVNGRKMKHGCDCVRDNSTSF